MRSYTDVINILRVINSSLDCTYPDENISKKVNFDKNFDGGVNVFLGFNDKESLCFVFEVWSVYDKSRFEYVDIHNPMFDCYLAKGGE